ncbi:unnamed protein product [Candida verbasci]|uniref:HSF-type DNA-binding domain-containing protein n=1 Tax=Candida verbasci TaxID=1227364 RepID=A0A9W4TZ92_9ASCO|nr:unnamed protein product [Candida verbasci]
MTRKISQQLQLQQPQNNQQHSSNNPPTDQKVKKNAFVHKLFKMLNDPKISHLIWWTKNNVEENTFALHPGKEFANCLTQYFKHGNVASFVRQLHMYGFHKVSDPNNPNNNNHNLPVNNNLEKDQSPIWEFKHSSGKFKKGDENSLIYIKRRSSSNSSRNSSYSGENSNQQFQQQDMKIQQNVDYNYEQQQQQIQMQQQFHHQGFIPNQPNNNQFIQPPPPSGHVIYYAPPPPHSNPQQQSQILLPQGQQIQPNQQPTPYNPYPPPQQQQQQQQPVYHIVQHIEHHHPPSIIQQPPPPFQQNHLPQPPHQEQPFEYQQGNFQPQLPPSQNIQQNNLPLPLPPLPPPPTEKSKSPVPTPTSNHSSSISPSSNLQFRKIWENNGVSSSSRQRNPSLLFDPLASTPTTINHQLQRNPSPHTSNISLPPPSTTNVNVVPRPSSLVHRPSSLNIITNSSVLQSSTPTTTSNSSPTQPEISRKNTIDSLISPIPQQHPRSISTTTTSGTGNASISSSSTVSSPSSPKMNAPTTTKKPSLLFHERLRPSVFELHGAGSSINKLNNNHRSSNSNNNSIGSQSSSSIFSNRSSISAYQRTSSFGSIYNLTSSSSKTSIGAIAPHELPSTNFHELDTVTSPIQRLKSPRSQTPPNLTMKNSKKVSVNSLLDDNSNNEPLYKSSVIKEERNSTSSEEDVLKKRKLETTKPEQ